MFTNADAKLIASGKGERRATILLPDGPPPAVFPSVERAKSALENLLPELRIAATRNNILLRHDAVEMYRLSRLFANSPDEKMDNLLSGVGKGIDLAKPAFFFITKELDRPVYSNQMDKLIRRIICK